jgi:enoyl-CoA hydratase/carnithine racemase
MPDDPYAPIWRASRDDRGIWILGFDRPGTRHNIICRETLRQLGGHLAAIEADPGARGLLVRGEKPAGFCAGADLKTIGNSATPAEVADFARLGQAVFARLSALAIPSVALVHGVCLGGGLELALACGSIVAREDADAPLSIGSPEIRLGLVPGWGAITALPRRLGLEPALPLLLEGQPIGTDRAVEIGLVKRGSSIGDFDPAEYSTNSLTAVDTSLWPKIIDARIRTIAMRDDPGRRARLVLLEILKRWLDDGEPAALEASATALGELAFTPEARQAMAPFLGR